ncbi:MAG: ABC transporter ATP-binding protein [Gemmobacter sp.]
MARSSDLSIQGVSKVFAGTPAVDDLSLEVPANTYVVLLGASGSGKTTLLSMIGGFTAPTAGRILLGGQDITLTPPAQRPTATVFQDYALFPHLTVADNVGFGLSVRGMPRAEIAARVGSALDMVGLAGFGPRRIGQASGGQRQRIALARALVTEPAILLLDEPLGALDLGLRRAMQDELRSLQRREGRTFLHVTHDQEEAMAIADMIVILHRGRIEDAGPPERVYARPRSRYAATFMGDSNILDARIVAGGAETALGVLPVAGSGSAVAIRPENLALIGGNGAVRLGEFTVTARVFQGAFARVTGQVGPVTLHLRCPPGDAPLPGQTCALFMAPGGATVLAD